MLKDIKVSIIIPNYNHALYFKQRIDSVLNQTFQDFELIILDDCSSDNSIEIIEQYSQNPKVSQIIFNQKNSGSVFKQWIKGIEQAKGEFIWIAESDDFAAEIFLQETIKVLKNDLSLGMVFTNTTNTDSLGEALTTSIEKNTTIFQKLKEFNNIIDHENTALFLVSEMIIENASSVLFRKNNLLQVDFNQLSQFKNTGDRFTYIGIALKSKILFLTEPLNFMRIHGDNTTKKNTENGQIHSDRVRVLNYYFENLVNSEYQKEIADFYLSNYFYFINFCSYIENIELLKNIKRTNKISTVFYFMIYFYMYLFLYKKLKFRIFRSLYYRILVLQTKKN